MDGGCSRDGGEAPQRNCGQEDDVARAHPERVVARRERAEGVGELGTRAVAADADDGAEEAHANQHAADDGDDWNHCLSPAVH